MEGGILIIIQVSIIFSAKIARIFASKHKIQTRQHFRLVFYVYIRSKKIRQIKTDLIKSADGESNEP